jgi:hypothetical protein
MKMFRIFLRTPLDQIVILFLHTFACHGTNFTCEDGHFPVSTSCVKISNPDLLSSSETGVSSEIRSGKKHSSE